jgi:hypothetical protein
MKGKVELRDASLTRKELVIEWSRVLGIGSCRIMVRRGIRRCKEDFRCDLN